MKLRVLKVNGRYRAQYKGWIFWYDCFERTVHYHPEHFTNIPRWYDSQEEAAKACAEYFNKAQKKERQDEKKVVLEWEEK